MACALGQAQATDDWGIERVFRSTRNNKTHRIRRFRKVPGGGSLRRRKQQKGRKLPKAEMIQMLGITMSSEQWTALSALATAAAAIIALLAGIAAVIVPSQLALRAEKEARRVAEERRLEDERAAANRRQQERDALAKRYHEAASATYNALDLVTDAVNAVETSDGIDRLPVLAARCRSSAETLGILARQPGLTDGAIDSCIGAQQALLGIVRANDYWRNDDLALNPWHEMEGSLLIAQLTMDRIGKVVNYHKIPVRAGRELPVLPATVRSTRNPFEQ